MLSESNFKSLYFGPRTLEFLLFSLNFHSFSSISPLASNNILTNKIYTKLSYNSSKLIHHIIINDLDKCIKCACQIHPNLKICLSSKINIAHFKRKFNNIWLDNLPSVLRLELLCETYELLQNHSARINFYLSNAKMICVYEDLLLLF